MNIDLSLRNKHLTPVDSQSMQPHPRIHNPMDLFIPNYSSHIRNNVVFISAPEMHSPCRLFSRMTDTRDRRRSSMTSPSRPSSPVLLNVHLVQCDAQMDRLSAISPSLVTLRPPTSLNCFAASISMVSLHEQMDESNALMLDHSTGYSADDDGDADPMDIFWEPSFAKLDDGDNRNQALDKKRRASAEGESSQWRDAAMSSHASVPADEANPRKKRKVKSPPTQTAALTRPESASSATIVPPRPAATAQGTRRTSATGSVTSQAASERGSAQPSNGRSALSSQTTRPPQPLQITRPVQSSPVARTGELKKPSQTPQAAVQSATPAEDVVIADVDPAPSPKVPVARMQSLGNTSAKALAADRSKKLGKRPPPLANVPAGQAGSGSAQHPSWQSAGSGSTASHVDVEGLKTGLPSATVSPVISGFPMHNADQATLDSFRNAQQIKDQQRELIQKRRQGRAPLTMDSPGIGPPPSAGVIPPIMYLHKNSVGSRRSEAVKQKVQGMRVSTSSEGYGRHNGLKTAPVGPSRQSQQQQQQPAHAAQSSHMRTTAHPDDGQDEDELMQDDVPTAAHMESGYVYSGQRPLQPPSARHLPQTAHPGLGGYPQGYPAPRYVDGDHPDMTHESERRRSLNGYVQPGVGPSTRARSPPAYPPGTAYGSAQPVYPPRLAQMSAVNGPPTAGLARGEYPPGTMYRPRQSSGYPSANGAGPSVRARSPGGRPIPGYANGSFDVEREHFMEPFHLLYDAFIDSMHLRRDLESKIRRANDLVEAQEAELRRISGLRIEFERALDRLQKDQDLLGAHPPKQPGEHRGNTSPPPSGGSDAQRAPTAPQAESVERDREVAEMRRKLQQMERQPR